MVSSIRNSSAVNSALYYLNQANDQASASAYRLSSGNAIYQASDDIYGLTIGTMLGSEVTGYKAALTNISQAQNMLNIASGGYRNIADTLNSMLSLATQANSGSLTTQAMANLDTQFQTLVNSINDIASNTTYNNINLIDGSLYVPASLLTKTSTVATEAQGTLTINSAYSGGTTHIFINGATIAMTTAANVGSLNATDATAYIDITSNSTAAQQANAVYNKVQSILTYSGSNSYQLTQKQLLSQMSYAYTANNNYITVTSNVAGTQGNGNSSCTNFAIGSDNTTANRILVNGGNAANITISSSVGIGYSGGAYSPSQIGTAGDLSGGSFPTAGSAYNSTATTIAQGTIGDSILQSLNTINQTATGIDASAISNNPAFVGTISGITASYVSANVINLSLTVGNQTYSAPTVNTSFAAGTKVTLSSNTGGGYLTLTFGANNIAVANQSDATGVASRLNAAFSTVSFYQKRNLSSYTAAGHITNPSNITIGDLASSTFQLIGANYTDIEIQNVSVTAPYGGSNLPTISFTINGDTYLSGYDRYGSASPLSSASLSSGYYGFVNQRDPNSVLVMYYPSATNLDVSTSDNASAAQAALMSAFGVNNGGTQVTFQTGPRATDIKQFQLKGASSEYILLDSNGYEASLNLLTTGSATTAQTSIENAIDSINQMLASTSAYLSGFNAAADNANVAIQNTEAAQSSLMDTDVSKESANYMQAQVKLQAAMAALSQANFNQELLLNLLPSKR